MAHKKGVGSTDNGRDSNAKRLGVKLFGGQTARAGNIILKQRGTKYHPGENVYLGKDFTVHAKIDGTVSFSRGRKNRVFVNIIPEGGVVETIAPVKAKAAPKKTAAPVAAAAPVKKAATKTKIELPSGKKITQDDLKVVEGVGPKIEGLLKDAGISTWKELADAPQDKVRTILDEAGPRYKAHQPATWAKQAELAVAGSWAELEAYQDWLIGGKAPEGETFTFGG